MTPDDRGALVPVFSNDWSPLVVPDLPDVQPHRSVSVVVPAYRSQETLDLTLAALSAQSYPDHLLEVVVVDDGSSPALVLPDLRPTSTRLLRPREGWGRANACQTGAEAAEGEVIHWLDSDMVPFHHHVLAQVRWHDAIPYAVTLGYKRFTDDPLPTPAQVRQAVQAGTETALFDLDRSTQHDWVEEEADRTVGLTKAGTHAFRVHVGATATLSAELLRAAGGMDRGLRLGEDSELGYRLATAGAVFIPEPLAMSWHLGPTHVMTVGDQVKAYNAPFITQRMPLPRFRRTHVRRVQQVPVLDVALDVAGSTAVDVVTCVDSFLEGTTYDVAVTLAGPWDDLHDGRTKVLAEPLLAERRVHETYRHDPRVRLVRELPDDVFPVPFRLHLPRPVKVAPTCVASLLAYLEREEAGMVALVTDGVQGDASAADDLPAHALLTRTAALRRAAMHGVRVDRYTHEAAAFLDRLFSVRWVDAAALGLGPRTESGTDNGTVPDSERARRWKEAAVGWKARAKELERMLEQLKTEPPPAVS